MILLLLALVVIGVVVVVARHVGGTTAEPAAQTPGRPLVDAGSDALDRWREAGLLDDERVEAIRRFEAERSAASAPSPPATMAPGHRSSRVPLVAEALGYLGGVLAGVGVVLVVTHYWDELAAAAQVGLTATASLALFGVGAIVGRYEDPAFARMRSFVWAASSAAAGACGVVLARGALDADDGVQLALAAAAVVTVHSGLLWRLQVRPIQQAITLAAATTAIGASVALVTSGGWWGLAVWLTGTAMVAVGLRRWGTVPELTEAIGAISMVLGAITVASEWPSGGNLFLVGTAVLIASTALVPIPVRAIDRWILGMVGAVACVLSVPATIGYYAMEAGAAVGGLTWMVGAALLALGLARKVHLPLFAQVLGSVAMLVGAGVVAAQWPSVAPAFGLLTAVGLLAIGSRPGAVLESLIGALGLLVYVPWAVARWFPGESRAPILLVVSGLLILAIAILIGRMGGRMRQELGSGGAP